MGQIIFSVEELKDKKSDSSNLTIIELSGSIISHGVQRRTVLCECICGQKVIVKVIDYLRGKRSCGCMDRRLTIEKVNSRLPLDSKLTAIKFVDDYVSPKGSKLRQVLCKCKCGNEKIIMLTSLARKTIPTKSCGCMLKESASLFHRKYSVTNLAIYNSYRSMMDRCYNEKLYNYVDYGAKGVRVCEDWKSSYQSFLDWSLNNGWAKGLCLDKDILGDGKLYSPETCKWVTRIENNNHRRSSRNYEYNGQQMSIANIARAEGIKYGTLIGRLKIMSLQDAISKSKKTSE